MCSSTLDSQWIFAQSVPVVASEEEDLIHPPTFPFRHITNRNLTEVHPTSKVPYDIPAVRAFEDAERHWAPGCFTRRMISVENGTYVQIDSAGDVSIFRTKSGNMPMCGLSEDSPEFYIYDDRLLLDVNSPNGSFPICGYFRPLVNRFRTLRKSGKDIRELSEIHDGRLYTVEIDDEFRVTGHERKATSEEIRRATEEFRKRGEPPVDVVPGTPRQRAPLTPGSPSAPQTPKATAPMTPAPPVSRPMPTREPVDVWGLHMPVPQHPIRFKLYVDAKAAWTPGRIVTRTTNKEHHRIWVEISKGGIVTIDGGFPETYPIIEVPYTGEPPTSGMWPPPMLSSTTTSGVPYPSQIYQDDTSRRQSSRATYVPPTSKASSAMPREPELDTYTDIDQQLWMCARCNVRGHHSLDPNCPMMPREIRDMTPQIRDMMFRNQTDINNATLDRLKRIGGTSAKIGRAHV
jgi:hypothetical protein